MQASHKNHSKDDKTQHLSLATICSTTQPFAFTSKESAFQIIYIIYKKVSEYIILFIT